MVWMAKIPGTEKRLDLVVKGFSLSDWTALAVDFGLKKLLNQQRSTDLLAQLAASP